MSSDKYLNDPPSESRPGGSAGDEVGHPAEQDRRAPDLSDTAGSPTDSNASSWAGRHPVGPPSDRDSSSSVIPGPVSPPTEDSALALAESLDLLRDSVRDLLASKRRTTAAAVSLEMRRRDHAFTPESVGFDKFRDFLRFAQGVGAVTLLPPIPGGDMEVLSAGARVPPGEAVTYTTTPPRPIRRDLWQAFVDWSPRWHRALDVSTGRIETLPAEPENNDARSSERQLAWENNPHRFRQIVPLTRDDQLQWMHAFVGQLPAGPEKDELEAALRAERPVTSFVEASRSHPEIDRSWRYNLTEQVTAAITRWMQKEQITTDIFHMPTRKDVRGQQEFSPSTTADDVPVSQAITRRAGSSDELRQQVLEAVARMSLSELLRLPIPAEYLLRR